jgi:hypothetical protein
MAFVEPMQRSQVQWQDFDGPDRAKLTVYWLDEDDRDFAQDIRGRHAYWIAQAFKARDAKIKMLKGDLEASHRQVAELAEEVKRLKAELGTPEGTPKP